MKKAFLIISASVCFLAAKSQVPEDVLRYSYFPQHGSARNMAIGGAMGSLGGDISALYVNPAGLGLYKTREIVLSPGFQFNNNKINFRGTEQSASKSAFDLGTSGMVIGFNGPNSKWTSQAFSFGVNQTNNFNNIISYKGKNSLSSYSEQFAEDIVNSGLAIENAMNYRPFAFGTAPAIYTYLVDVFPGPNGTQVVKGLPEFLLEKGIALDQEKRIETKGGIYEIALGYAANMDDKFYIGAGLGIPIVSYDRNTFYRESDPSGDKNNNFNYFELNDHLSTKGWGINAKLGAIYKPSEFIRLGLAVHTPTFYSLTDMQSSFMKTDTEGYHGVDSVKSTIFTNGLEGRTQYTALTPWKIIASGSYVFREINDTRKQKAFITADIEYVGYPGTNFRADGNNVTNADQVYYDDLKTTIKSYYKGAFNFRLGGELKFNTIMFRLGGAYYSNPYKDSQLKSNIIQASGGIRI